MKLKAYTILELVVVLAVVAIMTSLGAVGFIALRQNIQLQQTTSDVVGLFRDAQNAARNSVLSDVQIKTGCAGADCFVADGFAVIFSNNKLRLFACAYTVSGNTQVTCVEQSSYSSIIQNEVTIQAISGTTCTGVMFTRINANAVGINGASFGSIIDTGDCDYKVSLGLSGSRTISVNLDLNNIQLK